MAIISKNTEVQEELVSIYELILSKRAGIKNELKIIRKDFSSQCDMYIMSGYNDEITPIITNKSSFINFVINNFCC